MIEVFRENPRGPFSLDAARALFGGWPQLATRTGAPLVAAFPLEGWTGSAAVVVEQTAAGEVVAEVHAPAGEHRRAWDQVRAALSLDHDGAGFAAAGERDPVIGRLQRELGMVRPVCNLSPYEGSIARVLGQRISIAQQRRVRDRMADALGDAVEIEGARFAAFPRPQVLLGVDTWPGIEAEKLARLHAVCRAALEGELDRERLRALPVADALARLRRIRGVGDWSAQGILLRGAGLADEVPDDTVTRQAVERAWELERLPTQAEVLELAEAWRPLRMWAVVLLHIWLRNRGGGIDRAALGRPRAA